ncbi:hypothetical protein [Sphingopyxis terrae]|uniref:hypothetical protein n=1 Tax=Sphingopyxis terrae TaxID=33052 RepID=UPI000AFB01D3|nr:hypothetical protein [Sphingopyxis terrae]
MKRGQLGHGITEEIFAGLGSWRPAIAPADLALPPSKGARMTLHDVTIENAGH